MLLVALLGGLLMRLLAPDFDEVGESIWWAFLRLTDPGYLGDDEGLSAARSLRRSPCLVTCCFLVC